MHMPVHKQWLAEPAATPKTLRCCNIEPLLPGVFVRTRLVCCVLCVAQFGTNRLMQTVVLNKSEADLTPLERFGSAGVAGAVSAFIASPSELIIIQQQVIWGAGGGGTRRRRSRRRWRGQR